MQYPLPEGDADPYEHSREQHESFMKNRSQCVIGRDDVLKQVSNLNHGDSNSSSKRRLVVMLAVAAAAIGVVAAVATVAVASMIAKKILAYL